ncbi:transcriptional regulator, LysR family [Seinonella peptonophila]|uniref:Transcriptional regulator, LysR family n=1 Tax=Seinonella peptonophila TaxID=112248 RepID=A0A1M4TW15_9BACL|nr:LysR family transcriptional regulator [Seinonella peptonophila]SHE48616.1 transcriptional regulator, LysR family [Seinonella peptonophila]
MLEPLLIFVTVVEQKNFSRAAKLLHISQPSVSLHIQNLEKEFGNKLFHRSPQYVQVTAAGELLYQSAKKMITYYQLVQEQIDQLKNRVTGKMNVGASYTIGEYILPYLLEKYIKQYPLVDLEVTIKNTTQIMNELTGGQLDLALVEGKVQDTGCLISTFMIDELILLVSPSHPLASHPAIQPTMLHDHVWILREQGSGTRHYEDHLINHFKLRVKKSFIFSSNQGVKEAIIAGLGIAILSRLTVRREVENGVLREIPIHNFSLKRPLSIVQMKKNAINSKAVEILTQQLQDIATR